jgi:threonylcarbamoyladenosine tRNA methylthiotransferase MtaB
MDSQRIAFTADPRCHDGVHLMRVAITTLGCKVNQYDTAVIERLFSEKQWRQVPFAEPADAYVVNTCTVTDRADSDARKLARRAHRTNPDARVILTGCYAQTSPQQISELEYVDYVIGLGRLPDLLKAVEGELEDKVAVSDLRQANTVDTLGIASFPGRTRAFVKVQEGCNLFCTYCIVPVARGKSRSVSPRKVIEEIDRLEAGGYREIVLTGVHLGGYGEDLEPSCDLAFLLEAIAERRPRLRVRISSVDPPEITDRLIDIVAGSDVFCHHFHIPLQAGNDGVLGRMKRLYSAAEAHESLTRLRKRMPDVCIGTDIITGFPGETEDEYQATADYIEELELSYLHVFPYSVRSSTSAAKRWEALPDQIVHDRARKMRELDTGLRRRFQDGFIGRRADVLVERARDPESGLLKGYSNNYLPILATGSDALKNRVVPMEITERMGKRLVAEPIASVR